jgi:cyclohexa-1,5-dienecarbonyl-CoA hydratase
VTSGPIQVERLDGGELWRVTLGGSKGNILDMALTDALAAVVAEATHTPALKAMCLVGTGAHFSFGASVQEHLPDQVEGMLRRFHGLIGAVLDSSVITLAAVRGQCLGGGLELVTTCHRVFAAQDAKLGQPEIALGVFAPAASVLLAERVGRANAEDLCLSGRVVGAAEALRLGLVDEVVDGDPADSALAWARTHLLPRSATSLRHAARALRSGMRARVADDLAEVERQYLTGLMATHDAVEGLTAFLEKRAPRWRNA